MAEESLTEETTVIAEQKENKVMSTLKWGSLFLFFLFLFTFLKIPESRIKNFVQGSLSSALAPYHISLSAESTDLSVGWGVGYTMNGVHLYLPPPQPEILLDTVEMSPTLLSLFQGKLGGTAFISKGDSEVDLDFAMGTHQNIELDYEVDELDLKEFGILSGMLPLKGEGQLEGSGEIQGHLEDLRTLAGWGEWEVSDLRFPAQSVMGLSLPELKVGRGQIDFRLEEGKLLLNQFQIGQKGAQQIWLNLSGQIRLGRNWETSQVDLELRFGLPPNVIQALSFAQSLIQPGKQPDGSYGFKLQGRPTRMMPVPLKK